MRPLLRASALQTHAVLCQVYGCIANPADQHEPVDKIEFVIMYEDANGNRKERPLNDVSPVQPAELTSRPESPVRRIELDRNL